MSFPKTIESERLINRHMHKEGRILIVGAGIAGIAAAQLLQTHGYTVTVLEARNRIGGRIWTIRSRENIALDLGAQWIVGTQDNPVLDLARQWQLATVATDWFSVAMYTASGCRLPAITQRKIAVQLDKLLHAVHVLRKQRLAVNASDISLEAGIRQVLTEMNVSAEEQLVFNYILSTDIEHELAADLADLSLYFWDQEGRLEGDELLFPEGYNQIVTHLARGLDIRQNCVVEHVTTTSTTVTIMTHQGSFTAERAIITVPLGILQRNKIGFTPALPTRKQAAIRSLSFGVLNKVFLCFPSVFWSKEDVIGHITDQYGEWSWFINLVALTGQPVLLGLNAGKYGLKIESLPDTEIIMAAMRVLRKFYGQNIPDPRDYYITHWASDPFSYGSYSHIPPGGSYDSYDILGEPFDDRLFFAGEATSSKFAGTVHGAYLSGLREAKRIMALN